MKKQKSNKQFMILSALGILFVVDAHALSPLSLMTQFFPYNSFFMPMFIFISGYFFKKEYLEEMPEYLMKKVRTLLIPFFCWNLVYGILVNVLKKAGTITYGAPLTLRTLFIDPFLECFMFEINNPAWFVPALFLVVFTYALVRKLFGRIWNEYVATIVTIVWGTVCVFLARHGYAERPLWLLVLKTGFLLQFYQVGILYKARLEEYFRKIPKPLLLIVPIFVNEIVQYQVGDINVLSISAMSGFLNDVYLVPFITAISGICFWLAVAEILTPILGGSRVVNYVSNHTFTIMMHHIFFFNVLNLVVAVLVKLSVLHIPFAFEEFRSTAWYRFGISYIHDIWYVPVGMCGPLLVRYGYERFRNKYRQWAEKKTA